MTFGIITYILHKKEKDLRLYSYSPYISEMNHWVKLADQTFIAAPIISGAPTAIETAYTETAAIELHEIPSLNFTNITHSINSFAKLPAVVWGVFNVMRQVDHIHLRCPGNVGLIGCFIQILFPKKEKSVKYAGNWDPEAKQPWSYNLQKWILSNTFLTRNMQVLVYGEWPEQTKNIRPFFTASFSEKEIAGIRQKNFEGSLTFLFVGSLVKGKHPLRAIKLIQQIRKRIAVTSAKEISLKIYGDGPEREILETYCETNGLEEIVSFKGNQSLDLLKKAYQNAHFVILPSQSEGWPKALAEGMFFGCIPIATPVSCVPWMLGYGSRGILLDDRANGGRPKANGSTKEWSVVSGQPSEDLIKISELLDDPERMRSMSEEARKWSQQYTLEKFETAIKEVVNRSNEKSSSPLGRGAQG